MLQRVGRSLFGVGLCLYFCGCGSSEPAKRSDSGDPGPVVVPFHPWQVSGAANNTSPALESALSGSLAELLTKPRAELASLADECLTSIVALEKKHREDQLPFRLLPNARLPRVVPVFRQSAYSAKLGFSVPPYLPEGGKDSAVALHVAHFGDIEAARKLADPRDSGILEQIDALMLDRNYPLEWTRLVGLLLYRGQFLLAADQDEHLKRLMNWHKQLQQTLGSKAKTTYLGAALLPRGHGVLGETAAFYRTNEQTTTADQIETALAEWAERPHVILPVAPGATRNQMERLFGAKAVGRALSPQSSQRALDLLNLPFPEEGLDALVACFDSDDRLVDVLLSYRPRVGDYYGQPALFAQWFEESKHRQRGVSTSAQALPRRIYLLKGHVCEVMIVPGHPVVGALVRVGSEQPAASPHLARAFGVIDFDRSFEQTRQGVALHRRGNTIKLDDTELAPAANPVAALQPIEVVLQRAKNHDLLQTLTYRYSPKQVEKRSLSEIAKPLWALGGSASIEADRDHRKGNLAFIWQDKQTRYVLTLPNWAERGPELTLSDPVDSPQRWAAVQSKDQSERKARFTAKKLVTRLPRELARIRLGMPRAEVVKLLPKDDKTVVRHTAADCLVIFGGESLADAGLAVRELVVRFDAHGNAAELRVRGSERSDKTGSGQLLAQLKRDGGAPQVFQAPWSTVWADVPAARPAPVYYLWSDDATLVSWQQDVGGVEVVLRDRPPEHPSGVAFAPLSYLPRGPDTCRLSTKRAELAREWNLQKPVRAGDALVLTPRQPNPYDALLVWFDKDRVVRVVARHTGKNLAKSSPEQLAHVVQLAWSEKLSEFGWPRRQDHNANRVLQSWANHDDTTRIRVFWQQNQDGSREVFTEWKDIAP
jgi:hypothetical protein